MNHLEQYLSVSPEVRAALDAGKPVFALESTIISHGMPYPKNVETALHVEEIIRAHGATPATIAIIQGKMTVGCTREQIEYLGKRGLDVPKASRRDLPVLLARGMDGATTVTTAVSAVFTAALKPPWTFLQTLKSSPRRLFLSSVPAASPSLTSV